MAEEIKEFPLPFFKFTTKISKHLSSYRADYYDLSNKMLLYSNISFPFFVPLQHLKMKPFKQYEKQLAFIITMLV